MEEHLIQNEVGNKMLLRLRGANVYGKPLYRMVWSESRLWYLSGKWQKKYGHISPMWVVEAWRPAEFYGDPIWWAANDLGPYPAQGDYEFAQASPNDVFANISDDQAQRVITAIEFSSALTIPQRLNLYKVEQERKQKEQERILGDIVNDSKPAIHAKMPEHIERPKPNALGNRTGSYIIQSGEK